MKKCTECGVKKTYEEFHKNKATRDGYDSLCKSCRRVRNKEWARRNSNYQRDYYYRVTKPKRQEIARRKKQAKELGKDTNHTPTN